jgi:hypothetical protein
MPGSRPDTQFTRSTMAAEAAIGYDQSPRYFDADRGVLQSRVFADPVIYRQELASVFQRSWLFVGPGNWLSKAGDFVTSRMGSDEVLVWRGDDGALRVFINLCLAGFQSLCASPRGHADRLVCRCHGWHYDCRGRCDRTGRQLPIVARVDVHKGLVFANRDLNATPIVEWLGDFGWYLDLLLDRRAGGVEAYGEDAIRWTIDANWKVPAEAFCGDTYRELTAGAAAERGAGSVRRPSQEDGFQVFTGAGAMAILTPHQSKLAVDSSSQLGQPRDSLAPTIGTLFPTLSFDGRTPSLHVWHPLGPSKTEVHSFCIVDRDAPARDKENARRSFQFFYGPGGLRSQDDSPYWESISSQAARKSDFELNFQMGIGRERASNLPGRVGDLHSECNQRAFFSWWQRCLQMRSDMPTRLLRVAGNEAGG